MQAGLEVGVCQLAGGADGSLHAEFERLDEVMERLRPGVPVVALGSGIVTDLAKHACFTHEERTGEHLALVFCPTALSVLAYSTRMAVIAKDGVKRTWPSRLSDALVFDLTALAGAHYSDVASLLHEGAQDGLAMLAKMNVLGGLSVTLGDESAPLSGYEHGIGHMLDMGSEHFNRRLADHGAQVGVALIPHAIAFDALVRELDPDRVDPERCYPSAREMQTVVQDTFAGR